MPKLGLRSFDVVFGGGLLEEICRFFMDTQLIAGNVRLIAATFISVTVDDIPSTMLENPITVLVIQLILLDHQAQFVEAR